MGTFYPLPRCRDIYFRTRNPRVVAAAYPKSLFPRFMEKETFVSVFLGRAEEVCVCNLVKFFRTVFWSTRFEKKKKVLFTIFESAAVNANDKERGKKKEKKMKFIQSALYGIKNQISFEIEFRFRKKKFN